MILIYAGSGKGKTSACVGQAARAAGSGLQVAFGQFIKRDGVAGEQKILAAIPGVSFKACGLGFIRGDLTPHREKAAELLDWALRRKADLLILDEALNALERGLITREALEPFMEARASRARHLVLSGRGAPAWLAALADTYTDMREVRHQHKRGVEALPGLEY